MTAVFSVSSGSTLLQKTRRLNSLLQQAEAAVQFGTVAGVMADLLEADVYVVSQRGKVLGAAPQRDLQGQFLPDELVYHLKRFDATAIDLQSSEFRVVELVRQAGLGKGSVSVVPIFAAGDRLGSLVVVREKACIEEDVVLAEYGSTVVGLEILRASEEERDTESRLRSAVNLALSSLSYSEVEAVRHIFANLEGTQGVLVASKIADKVGLTRSVIVNALRKLESAGVLESRSLGMKGTFIKVLNPGLVKAVAALN